MSKVIEITLSPEEAFGESLSLNNKLDLPESDWYIKPLKRSIDARARKVVVRMQVEAIKKPFDPDLPSFNYPDVSKAAEVIVVGSGPAGLFAALRLIELGFRPIVLERGKDVQSRRRDLAAINKENIVNPESNYCFGEGGAGTYSDGKLYTRSKKRGNVLRILQIMVANGATSEILFDTHPHIGTNKLPKLVAALREQIVAAGGIFRFDAKVTDLIIESSECKGVKLSDGENIRGVSVILATGHSARDIFHILNDKKILIEAKAFALGLRIEHHQNLIDKIQYHCEIDRGPFLPASSYALVHQAKVDGRERGVFSFCMCPGGFIVPAATAPGEVVVNGMSPSRRDSKYANSGIVVTVEPGDFKAYFKYGPLAGMHFQSDIERKACAIAGGTQVAPAQRMIDFTKGRVSATLPDTSYQPGLASAELSEVLPGFITESLRQGLVNFGSKMKGYLTNEAQVVGVESRTSSPVRIPRNDQTLEHPQVARLFPCGEGAGYAGGIVSAAMDGERCAEAIAAKYVISKVL
ncbi:MAG TPA: FAD-binding protein [Cyclobacteriaceae bacterium]|nr:FAD-binding protein [Cyclobacteriaceae bacterium]